VHPLLLLASAGGLFAALPYAARGGQWTGTVVPMALAIAFAVAAAGRPGGLAVMAGAVAAFAGSLAWSMMPALGGSVVVGLAYAERGLRVRPVRARLAHLGLALVAGGAAGALSASYAASPLLPRGVAAVMCAVLAALPFLVEADDPRVLFLEAAARRIGPPVASTLLDGVELLRCDLTPLDRETRANVEKSWRSLERIVEARLAILRGSARTGRGETAALVTAMVDRQITEHVASLTRAYAAAATMGAAEAGIDDRALRDVDARGEALDEQTRAIVEVGGVRGP
jgi:hypothetical protein